MFEVIEDSVPDQLTTCAACQTPRMTHSFDPTHAMYDMPVCTFCHDEGRAPELPALELPPKPARKGKKAVLPPSPASLAPMADEHIAEAVLGPAQQPLNTTEEAAYTPPQFDKRAARANPQAELASRTLARRSLLQFTKRFRPKYDAGWVHKDICRRLERFARDVELGKEPRLLMMLPPRTGKSEIGSRHFPPWILGQHPDWEIIAASHTTSLSMSFSRYIRDMLRDPAYNAVFPNAKLDPSSQSVENWNLTQGGGYLAAGVGSAITGRGAHILILDDLVRDQEASDSPSQRDSTWEWYISTAHSRLAPGGGVLGIMCMTGDTPVLMATGVEQRLDSLVAGDRIATYDRGVLSTSVVQVMKSSGQDSTLRIRTSSGKMVRANGRHPFLTTIDGELKWTRARDLSTAHRIVTLPGSGASGQELPVPSKAAANPLSAEVCACPATARSVGPTDTALAVTSLKSGETPDSNTAMGSPLPTTPRCSAHKKACAPSAGTRRQKTSQSTGVNTLLLTTAMTQGGSEGCCATDVTSDSDTLALSPWHVPQSNTSDFTLEQVVSVEVDVVEEVFDVQVERTENFIANGMVSHNTTWNEDDWAGRIQQVMASGEGEVFEIVRYPAINEMGDEYILPDDSMAQIAPGLPVPEGAYMTRKQFSAVHEARYTFEAMMRKKRNYIAAGMKRMWDALYQQNPTPDEGNYFTKNMFKPYTHAPSGKGRMIYQAWDFAITEGKQSDWTVGSTILQDEHDDLYVLDVLMFKSGDGIEIIETILDYQQQWKADLLGFEDGQIWKALSAQFKRRCEERRVYPNYELLVPLTDKMTRASPLRGRMQLGKVYFPTHAAWYTSAQKQLLYFPAGKHDDVVDSLAWAVRLTLSHSAPKIPEAQRVKSWRDKLKALVGLSGSHMAA